MDLYADKSASVPQKLSITAIEAAILLLSGYVLFGPGGEMISGWFGWPQFETIPARRYVIFGFSVVILLRMAFTMFYLMKRTMPWAEVFSVPAAFSLYYLGFAIAVLPSDAPLGWIDYAGIALFALGCYLNTASELDRDRFKKDPANKGKIYSGGLWGLSMHINFFGDIVWITAYAVVAQSLWACAIPLLAVGFFAFYNVPMLDAHLAKRYGDQFTAYAARTKKLVPFVW
ncbi:DUF1295 domain-containing protein [Cucumibacter marinus]|uniref:DUF1295 domain-containing protein n=1 Tax=Cucumibacter marinus TaxID=1121252 RepID=UPI0004109C0D|nr:DUF1295 domain-containing protein [Cucumibacter marinus]